MENTVKTITIYTQEVKNGKQTFFASSTQIKSKWYKVKFTKECTDKPDEKGMYELTIAYDDMSIERGKTYVKKDGKRGTENDTIWVHDIVALRKYTEDELKQRNREVLDEVFGD